MVLLDEAQVEMECLPDESVPREQQIGEVSDAQLVQHLCCSRAVFSVTADGSSYRQVECLPPYNPVSSEVHTGESIIIGRDSAPSSLSRNRFPV